MLRWGSTVDGPADDRTMSDGEPPAERAFGHEKRAGGSVRQRVDPGPGGPDPELSLAAENVERLTRSTNRIHLLTELYRHGQLHRDQLKRTSEVSRTTLQRNLDVLVEEGWVRNSGVTYWITSCGELVAEVVLDLVETVGIVNQLQEVFRWIPVSEVDVDLRLLADAEVWTPEPGDPYAMMNRHVQLLRTMDSGRGVLAVTGLHPHKAVSEAVVRHDANVELVATPEVAETLTSTPQYAPLTEEMVETGRFDLSVYEGEVPFSLVIADDGVHVVVDEEGDPRALLESGSDEVREWATGVYEEYRREATPIA